MSKLVFYYRNGCGGIEQFHDNRANWTKEEAEQRMAEYNAKGRGTVHMMEIEEGGFVEYLYKLATERAADASGLGAVMDKLQEAVEILERLGV